MAKQTKKGSGSEKVEQVALLLREKMKAFEYPESLIEAALRVWEIFSASEEPRVRAPGAYAASVEYTLIHLYVDGIEQTQKDIARRYSTTVASISRISQWLIRFLAEVPPHEYIPAQLLDPGEAAEPEWGDEESMALDELIPPPIFEMVKQIPQTREVWVGGRRTLNTYITDPVPRRPDVILFADASGHPMLGQMVLEAEAPKSLLLPALVRTMLEPLVGEPRRPRRLVIANQSLVLFLRELLEPFGIQVDFGAVAVVDALVTLLEAHFNTPREDDPPESYLGEGRIAQEEISCFFEASAQLYRVAPWSFAQDYQVLAVDLHDCGYKRVTVSILGAVGQTMGLLAFEDMESFRALEAMIQARKSEKEGNSERPAINILAVEFSRGGDLSSNLRQEILAHGWEVADPLGYPTLQMIEGYRFIRPNTAQDYRAAAMIAYAVAEFMEECSWLFGQSPPGITRFELPHPFVEGGEALIVSYPHPDYT